VQQGGARAGEADHDQRGLDALIRDARVALAVFHEPQPPAEHPYHLPERRPPVVVGDVLADGGRVLSGEEWDGFLARLAEAGRLIRDGSIPATPADRAVVAHADPGVPNWLDTLGHQQGALLMRIMPPRAAGQRPRPRRSLAETRDDWMAGWADEAAEQAGGAAPAGPHQAPSARVVAAADLREHLPAGTPRVTGAHRRGILDERLRQVTRLQRS
jgi:hypothetical protein